MNPTQPRGDHGARVWWLHSPGSKVTQAVSSSTGSPWHRTFPLTGVIYFVCHCSSLVTWLIPKSAAGYNRCLVRYCRTIFAWASFRKFMKPINFCTQKNGNALVTKPRLAYKIKRPEWRIKTQWQPSTVSHASLLQHQYCLLALALTQLLKIDPKYLKSVTYAAHPLDTRVLFLYLFHVIEDI